MTVIIRPNPGVFRGSMPLVVMFGCFRRYDAQTPLDEGDVDTTRRVVALARRYRIPLAFSRVLDDPKNPAPGFWLPNCRPKICDRMFEHGPGSIFANREFSNVFGGITDRRIFFAGPCDDSTLQDSASDILATLRDVQVIAGNGMLQLCSAEARTVPPADGGDARLGKLATIPIETWEYSTHQVEYAA